MYHTQLAGQFDADLLASFLAERITSQSRVLFVGQSTESLVPALREAWLKQQSRLMAERDHEADIAYMATLTDIVTAMQLTRITTDRAPDNEEFLFVDPADLEGSAWENRLILVACDDQSTEVCTRLLKDLASDFSLFVTIGKNFGRLMAQMREPHLHPLEDAQVEFRRILRRQQALCGRAQVNLADIISGDITNVSAIGTAVSEAKNNQVAGQFRSNQKKLADLRIVCGRAKPHRSLSDEQLHGLKVITKYLSADPSADAQLFDNPYGITVPPRHFLFR